LDYWDKERYGLWLTISSIISWFGFFDLGLASGLRNKFAESMAKDEVNLSRELVSTTYALMLIISGILITVFTIVSRFLDWTRLLNTSVGFKSELSMLILIVFFCFCLRFVFNIIGQIYLADQRPAISNSINLVSNMICLAVIYLLKQFNDHSSLLLMGTILSVVPVATLVLVNLYSFRFRYRSLKPAIKFVNFGHAKDLLNLGFKFFLLSIASLILFSTANILITHLHGPANVTVYNIAYKYFTVTSMIFSIIMIPYWSAFTEAYIKEDLPWIKKTIHTLNKLSILFSFGTILMFIFSKYAFRFWVGDKVVIPVDLSIALTVFTIFSILFSPYTQFLKGVGKLGLGTAIIGVKLLIYIPLALWSSSRFGLSGIVWAMVVINFSSILLEPIQTYRILNKTAQGIWNR
jgi:O-antigen/teichoic acid export membrane protein